MPLLLALALLAPSEQTLVYYNARMALREGQPREALKLWMLRNAIESRSEVVSAHDEDFRSVTWAALGQLGLCLDGYARDEGGAGLWPLALHNSVVRNMRRPEPAEAPNPFAAFEIGRQQRDVSLHDVLDFEELRSLEFRRTPCWQHLRLLVDHGESWFADRSDRRVTARLLRHLLRQGLKTLRPGVRGRAVLQARIFDVNLRLAGLNRRAERRARRRARYDARQRGLSKAEQAELLKQVPSEFDPDSEEGRILRESLTWPAEEWMSMSRERRTYLFSHARKVGAAPGLTVQIIDQLIERRAGAELESWIADVGDSEAARRVIWRGERGRRLLSLDRDTGFRGRSAIALHRGIGALSAGRLPEALRTLARAIRWSEGAPSGEALRNLSRRWLSFVAAQFRVSDELFAMLRTVLPRGDYTAVLEDQL